LLRIASSPPISAVCWLTEEKNGAAGVHPHGEGLSLHYINTVEAMTTVGVFVIRLSSKALKPVAKAC
jgi:hypothetical protein